MNNNNTLLLNASSLKSKLFSLLLKCGGFVLIILLFTSCGSEPLKVDVSSVPVPPLAIMRMDQDIFRMDTSDVIGSSKKLRTKYGPFFASFMTGVINNGEIKDSSYAYRVKSFIKDRDMRKAYDDCQKAFPSTDALADQFTDVFKHFKHYFPNKHLPQLVTMMSGFNRNIVVVDSTIAIGLEMYLGDKNEFYQMLALPHYKTIFMNKDNVVPDAVRAWMLAEFPYNMNSSDMLSQIVYMGKVMYAADALMPEVPDTIKAQYTQKQLNYCIRNEFNVWGYFAAQKLLYTADQAEVMKYTADGPFTSALSKESAPRIGYWIGWQIVRQYMKNNPTVTLEQLMAEGDAQKILTKAKYKPLK